MYATKVDMIAEFGESEVIALTDRGGVGVVDDDVLARGLERATSEIDGYLAGRFQLGNVTPPALVGICSFAAFALGFGVVLRAGFAGFLAMVILGSRSVSRGRGGRPRAAAHPSRTWVIGAGAGKPQMISRAGPSNDGSAAGSAGSGGARSAIRCRT